MKILKKTSGNRVFLMKKNGTMRYQVMKQTILIHGAPYEQEFYDPEKSSPSNSGWFPWLQKQVALKNGLCQALEFPRPFDPLYEDWVSVFEQFKINEESILIGHSCGGGFLIRYLSENKNVRPAKVILVAPWIDTGNELTTDFFKFDIDTSLTDRTVVHLIISHDDIENLSSFVVIQEKLPKLIIHQFTDKEHFTEKEFPELLELI